MKRIISFILCSILILGCLPLAFAEAEQPTLNWKEPAKLVSALGIMPDIDESTANTAVKRGEFVSYVVKGLNAGAVTAQTMTESGFSDVTADHSYFNDISYARSIGLIGGSGNGTFLPDDSITLVQAVKILVSALGYQTFAEIDGGYPTGYMMRAQSLKILRGVSGVSPELPLSKAASAILIFNALQAPYMKMVSVGSEGALAGSDKSETWLSDGFDIKTRKGVVEDNGVSTLLRVSNLPEGTVVIDGKRYSDPDRLAHNLLGYGVTAYSRLVNSKEVLIHVSVDEQQNNILKIDAQDLLVDSGKFSRTCIAYEDENGKEIYAKVASDADYIYNNVAYPGCTAGDMKIAYGTITLLCNDGSGVYNVVYIDECETFIVGNVATDEQAIYDIYTKEKVVLASDSMDITYYLFDADFNPITYKDIKEGSILSVYKSKDGSYVRIINTLNTMSGYVTAINEADRLVTVNDTIYTISAAHSARILARLNFNTEYMFYLNERQDIVEFKEVVADTPAAYVITATFFKEGAFDETLHIKAFTLNGVHEELKCAEEIIYNGSKIKLSDYKNSSIFNNLVEGDFVMQYQLNEDGLIKEIDTPYVTKANNQAEFPLEDLNSMHYADMTGTGTATTSPGTNLRYMYQKMYIGEPPKVFMKKDYTWHFSIPTDRTALNEYEVSQSSLCINARYYSFKAFYENADTPYVKYDVGYDLRKDVYNSKLYIAGEKSLAVNDEGVTVSMLKGWNNGKYTELLGKDTAIFDSVEEGDVISARADSTGAVVEVKHALDASAGTAGEFNTQMYGTQVSGIVRYIWNRQDNIYTLTENASMSEAYPTDAVKYVIASSTKVFFYNSSEKAGKKISSGTVGDLLDYTHTGVTTKAFIYGEGQTVQYIIILR